MPALAIRGNRSVRAGESPYRILDLANWCDVHAMGCALTGYPDFTVYHFVPEQIQLLSGYEMLYRPSHEPIHPTDRMGSSPTYVQSMGWHGFTGLTLGTGDLIVQDWEHHSEQEGRLSLGLESRLRALAALQENWNSYGAAAISERAVERAREILRRSLEDRFARLPSPAVAPSSDGGLSIEWETASHDELIIDVPPEGPWSYLLVLVDVEGHEDEREGTATRDADVEALLLSLRP